MVVSDQKGEEAGTAKEVCAKEKSKEPLEKKADQNVSKEASGKEKESSTPNGAKEGRNPLEVSDPSGIVDSAPPSKPTGAGVTKHSATTGGEDKTEGARILPEPQDPLV